MTSGICWAVGVPPATGDRRSAFMTGISNVAGSAVTILHAKGANLIDDPALRATLKAFGAEIPVDERSPQEMLAEAVARGRCARTLWWRFSGNPPA